MKLSMWMIANRLSSLDMELDIREDAPAVLNSARRVYATNCVHVYQENEYAVCNGEGDIIRIQNMSAVQAFEIVQSVFDYFEDWMEEISLHIRQNDYQKVISLAWQVFRNPLVLMDSNNKVLGITREYGPEDVDDEWGYLYRYGYSSLTAVQEMRYQYSNINFLRHGSQSFQFGINPMMNYPGISYCMDCNDAICGRITLLERDRPLNHGDDQLLEKLAQMLEPSLGRQYYASRNNTGNVMYNVLFGKAYDTEKLNQQLQYQQWKEDDTYQLALVSIKDTNENTVDSSDLDTLVNLISQHLTSCVVLKKKPYVLILSNRLFFYNSVLKDFITRLLASNPVKIGYSLPFNGVKNIRHLFKQSRAALQYGNLRNPSQSEYYFYYYAIDFIINSPSLKDSYHACYPVITQLWEAKQNQKDELFDTLKTYLDNDCSVSRTAAAMYAHRNTVQYRLKKIGELLGENLDDLYLRDYCRMSIRVLELYTLKMN